MDIIKLISFEWFGKIYKFLDCEIRELLKTENANKVIGISNNGKELVATSILTKIELTSSNFWSTLKSGSTSVSVGDTITFRQLDSTGNYEVLDGSFTKINTSSASYVGSGALLNTSTGKHLFCNAIRINDSVSNEIVVMYINATGTYMSEYITVTSVTGAFLLHHQ